MPAAIGTYCSVGRPSDHCPSDCSVYLTTLFGLSAPSIRPFCLFDNSVHLTILSDQDSLVAVLVTCPDLNG